MQWIIAAPIWVFLISSPLPGSTVDPKTLKAWFRQFIEVRDGEGAERCLATALRNGADAAAVADMLFAAVTDHRYLTIGHVADFTNKAFEALDQVSWEYAPVVLPSLIPGYVNAIRMEERNAWRHPPALEKSRSRPPQSQPLTGSLPTLLGDNPQAIVTLLLDLLADDVTPVDLVQMVSYAATRRIAHFHTSNEFGDWDTVLHTFTYTNAIKHALRRAPSGELLRGVFDAAMSVYLDRFLNIPSMPLPQVEPNSTKPEVLRTTLLDLLNTQQQVNEAGRSSHKVGDPTIHSNGREKF